MQHIKTPVSKPKMALMWLIFIGFGVGLATVLLWGHRNKPLPDDATPRLVQFIVMLVIGGLFFVGGVASYLIVLATDCFTFNFERRVWKELKGKLYVANIVVLSGIGLGLGSMLAPFVSPALTSLGLGGEIAMLLPVMAMVLFLQVVRIFVLIWAPVEKRVIAKRLQARGIAPAQLQGAILAGISDPSRSSLKKLTEVEDDIGALWVGPEQLIYWGDNDQFAITGEQLMEVERKADAGAVTLLGGVSHIILRYKQGGGIERQTRLHIEGHWTLGGTGKAMDLLEERILQWHGTTQLKTMSEPRRESAESASSSD
jgi:MFS family permease